VPLTSIWVMPWAVAAVFLMPFGLEALALVPMGWGIDGIMLIADTVAGWPGAAQPMPGMPMAGLIMVVLGGLWFCLWRRRWRWMGVPVILLGLLSTLLVRQPDILVSEDGDLMAIRYSGGAYLFSSLTRSKFEREIWLRRAGLENGAAWPAEGYSSDRSLACDSLGCIHRIHGLTVALALKPAALPEDCSRADIVISVDSIRGACAAHLRIDWRDRRRNGAYALWVDEDGAVEIMAVDDLRGRRPWVAGTDPLSAPDDPPALKIERVQR
jgi:competence protein ComEC